MGAGLSDQAVDADLGHILLAFYQTTGLELTMLWVINKLHVDISHAMKLSGAGIVARQRCRNQPIYGGLTAIMECESN